MLPSKTTHQWTGFRECTVSCSNSTQQLTLCFNKNFTTTAAFTLYITNESQPLHFRFMISRPDARETGGKLLSLSLNDGLRNTQNTHSCRQLYRRTFLLNHCTLIRNCPSLPPRVHFRCESARVHFRPSTNNNEDGTDGREGGGEVVGRRTDSPPFA